MKCTSATARILTVGVLMAFGGFAVAQQAYPNKPIRAIIPYAPGGASDIFSRLVGAKLSEALGQSVIVENRAGGNTRIGAEIVAKSLPDGLTILSTSSSHVIPQAAGLPTPYDAIKSFAPIATFVKNEFVLLLNTSVPANNLQELIALAKSKPGQLNYGTAGGGSITHLTSELFCIMTDVRMQSIPYKGGGQSLTALISGEIQIYFSIPGSSMPHIKSGKLKAIAVSGETRLSALPQVPTFTEASLPGFDVKNWYGFLAPAGTPKEIIDKLATEIAKILAIPDFKETLVDRGVEPFVSTPEQFGDLIKNDMAKFAKLIKSANIKFEN